MIVEQYKLFFDLNDLNGWRMKAERDIIDKPLDRYNCHSISVVPICVNKDVAFFVTYNIILED